MHTKFPEASNTDCLLDHKGWNRGRESRETGVAHLGAYGTLYFQNNINGRKMHSWNCRNLFFITLTFNYSIKKTKLVCLRGRRWRRKKMVFLPVIWMWYNAFQKPQVTADEEKTGNVIGEGSGDLPVLRSTLYHFVFLLAPLTQTLPPNCPCCKADRELSFLVLKTFLNYIGNTWIHSCCKRLKQYRSMLTTHSEKAPVSIPLPWGGHSSWFGVCLISPFSIQSHTFMSKCTYVGLFFFYIYGLILCVLFWNFFYLHKNVLEILTSGPIDLLHSP